MFPQDQFAFEDYRVVDAVIMGHKELWKIKAERERIYGLPEMSEEDGIKVAELEMEFAEMDGYSAESSASELLQGLDIPLDQHYGLMSEIASTRESENYDALSLNSKLKNRYYEQITAYFKRRNY